MSILRNDIELTKIKFNDLWKVHMASIHAADESNRIINALIGFFEQDPETWDEFIRVFSTSWYHQKAYICTDYEDMCHMRMLKIATFLASFTGRECIDFIAAYWDNKDGTFRPSVHIVVNHDPAKRLGQPFDPEYWIICKFRSEAGITTESVLGKRNWLFGHVPMKDKYKFNINPKNVYEPLG